MKLVIGLSVFVILAISNNAMAQVYGNYFFGENYKNYLGLQVKLDIENGSSHLETLVFSTIPSSASDYDKMEDDISRYNNTVFVVDSIFDFTYKPESKLLKVFRLRDKVGKKSIYYTYNSAIREFHYLLTEFGKGGYDIKYEELIEKSIDDFTGEIKIKSINRGYPGTFYKFINKGKVSYYFSTSVSSSGIYYGRGIRVLFTDGSQWIKSNEVVDVDYDSGIENSVFVKLSQVDLEFFKKKIVKKIRVYIHDKAVDQSLADEFRTVVNFIISKKR